MVAYGRIIPPWMLALPRLGCINLHGSLLPKYRGAAPIQWAVAMGDAFTGNTTMLLEEGLDTGPILLQQTVEIGPIKPRRSCSMCWPTRARRWWSRLWRACRGSDSSPQPQNHAFATFAPLLDREDGRMDFAARTATRTLEPLARLSALARRIHRRSTAKNSSSIAWQCAKQPVSAARIGRSRVSCRVEDHRLFAACAGRHMA